MAVVAAVAAPAAALAQERPPDKPVKKVHWEGGKRPEKTPLFNPVVSYGNLVFVSGIGAHFEGDIKAHTKHVLDEIQKRSSGRFVDGKGPEGQRVPERSEGLRGDERGLSRPLRDRARRANDDRCGRRDPGNSLVEIDCIACI